MRFHLNQSLCNQEIEPLLRREIKKKHRRIPPLSPKELKETAEISAMIHQTGLPTYLVCKKLNSQLGYGIFLHPEADPLVKGQVIAPYAGEISLVPQNAPDDSTYAFSLIQDIVLEKKDQHKWDPVNRYHPKRLYSFKLDAWKKGNFTRFINHCEQPNLISYMVSIPKNSFGLKPAPIEVIYFVKKKIQPGEQLLVSYEASAKNYWNAHKGKAYPMTPRTFKLNADLKVVG